MKTPCSRRYQEDTALVGEVMAVGHGAVAQHTANITASSAVQLSSERSLSRLLSILAWRISAAIWRNRHRDETLHEPLLLTKSPLYNACMDDSSLAVAAQHWPC